MMTAAEFVRRCMDAAQNHKTLYVSGCFGAPLTGRNVDRYLNNNRYNRNADRQKMILDAANQDPPVFGFDCVGLIKGILWGWTGDPSQLYGGAKYASNGVPDIDEDRMIDSCTYTSDDFAGIVPGAVVWMRGHIGVYIGDGLAVECTPKWDNKVQITAIWNIGKKVGYNARTWTQWGLLPYVDYTKEEDKTVTYEQWKEYMDRYRAELGTYKAAQWAVPSIEACIDDGIMSEVNGSIARPADLCTRQEAAVIAANLLKHG